jgi:DNA-directed RNA polymerase subunit RPC12/RpoP
VGLVGASLLGGCVSKISDVAVDKEMGEPYRCTKCGYLTRSKTDLSDTRCPRCHVKKMVKISEEEMAKYLAEGQ